jgi:hypothetical protein
MFLLFFKFFLLFFIQETPYFFSLNLSRKGHFYSMSQVGFSLYLVTEFALVDFQPFFLIDNLTFNLFAT